MIKYDYSSSLTKIFIAGFLIFLLWNYFDISDKLSGEKISVKGKIIEINIGYGTRGVGYNQIITFVYNINDKWYEGRYKNSGDYSFQYIGNIVLLNVVKESPDKYKVINFKRIYNVKTTNEKTYLRSFPNKYTEIKLINNIVYISEYSKGKVLNKIIGESVLSDNTLTIKPIKSMNYLKNGQYETSFIKNSKKLLFNIKEDTIINKETLINMNDTNYKYIELTL